MARKYTKPGQLFSSPPKSCPLRRFYSSLHKQKKNSTMAMKWMLEYGLFSKEKAARVYVILKLGSLDIQ